MIQLVDCTLCKFLSHSELDEVPSKIFGSSVSDQSIVNTFISFWDIDQSLPAKEGDKVLFETVIFGIQILLVEISMLFTKKSCQLVLKKFGFKKLKKIRQPSGIILLELEESLRALHASGQQNSRSQKYIVIAFYNVAVLIQSIAMCQLYSYCLPDLVHRGAEGLVLVKLICLRKPFMVVFVYFKATYAGEKLLNS